MIMFSNNKCFLVTFLSTILLRSFRFSNCRVFGNNRHNLLPVSNKTASIDLDNQQNQYHGRKQADQSNLTQYVLEGVFFGGSSQSGIMFDLIALQNMTIVNLDIHTTFQSQDVVQIWSRSESWETQHESSDGWFMTGCSAIVGAGYGSITSIDPDAISWLHLVENKTVGIYVTLVFPGDWMQYTESYLFGADSFTGALFMENEHVQILVGAGKTYPFGLGTFYDRVPNINLYYFVGLHERNEPVTSTNACPPPSQDPTYYPTRAETLVPSWLPTYVPSESPTNLHSSTPSRAHSQRPSLTLSHRPTVISEGPTIIPSKMSSNSPSIISSNSPSQVSSLMPSVFISSSPTLFKSREPSRMHSLLPSFRSYFPSPYPTVLPSQTPSNVLSEFPSKMFSEHPSKVFSEFPSKMITQSPSELPSELPSQLPSQLPTISKSFSPSGKPSVLYSSFPTITPTSDSQDLVTTPPSSVHIIQSFMPSKQNAVPVNEPLPIQIEGTSQPTSIYPSFGASIIFSDQPTLLQLSEEPSEFPSLEEVYIDPYLIAALSASSAATAATIAVSYALSHGPSDSKESFSFPRETRKSMTTSSRNSNLSLKKRNVMDSKSTDDYSMIKDFQSDEGYTQNEVVKIDLENGSTDHIVVQTNPHLSLKRFEETQKSRYINMGITKKRENDGLRRWVGTKESAVRVLMLRSDRIPRPMSFASSPKVNDVDSFMRSLRERQDLLCHFKKVECHSLMANSRIINWMKNEGDFVSKDEVIAVADSGSRMVYAKANATGILTSICVEEGSIIHPKQNTLALLIERPEEVEWFLNYLHFIADDLKNDHDQITNVDLVSKLFDTLVIKEYKLLKRKTRKNQSTKE